MRKSILLTTLLLAVSSTAVADKQADLAFELEERHSYTQSLVVTELMTFRIGAKCWDTLLDKKKAPQMRVGSATHTLAKYGSTQTGGDDWRKLESQGNNNKEKNRQLVRARVAEIKSKLHVTIKVEGDDCDGTPLWLNYLGETMRALEAHPPKSGKAFITINVLASAKGVKAETKDGSTFTITASRDIESSGWSDEIRKAFKRVSSKD